MVYLPRGRGISVRSSGKTAGHLLPPILFEPVSTPTRPLPATAQMVTGRPLEHGVEQHVFEWHVSTASSPGRRVSE